MMDSLPHKSSRFFEFVYSNDGFLSYNANKLILVAMCFLLWVDALTGAMVFYGVPIGGISVLYKLFILFLVFIVIAGAKPKVFSVFIITIITLMIGPSRSLMTYGDMGFYFGDFALLFKIVTPLIVFIYCYIVVQSYPSLAQKWFPTLLYSNFFAVCANLVLGLMGFGFPSYSGVDGQPGIGVNGFYVAGNEFSACFVLLFGFVLHRRWNAGKITSYLAMSLLAFVFATAIATKAAMLATLGLIFLIPLFNEREKLFQLTKLKLFVFIPFLVSSLVLIIFIGNFLEAVGLYDKFVWVLEEKGVLTLILSGRDIKAEIIFFGHFLTNMGELDFIFGIGSGGIKHFEYPYYSVEIDPLDVGIWFGILGLVYIVVGLFIMNYVAFRELRSNSFYPPIVVLINLILLGLSFVSGHIWTSGMLGILWGVFNALVLIPPMNPSSDNPLQSED